MRKYLQVIALAGFTLLMTACASNQPAEEETACVLNPPKQPYACTMEYDPVCGCDGKTYGNACSARGAGVPSHTPGECADRAD